MKRNDVSIKRCSFIEVGPVVGHVENNSSSGGVAAVCGYAVDCLVSWF